MLAIYRLSKTRVSLHYSINKFKILWRISENFVITIEYHAVLGYN